MKLLFCPACGDVFKLSMQVRSCECGRVSGHYEDYQHAVTNGAGYSLAIGNGSLASAMCALAHAPENSDRRYFIDNNKVKCWMRFNEGAGNPHTKIKENLKNVG